MCLPDNTVRVPRVTSQRSQSFSLHAQLRKSSSWTGPEDEGGGGRNPSPPPRLGGARTRLREGLLCQSQRQDNHLGQTETAALLLV
eukprot:750542-Hanusia_phi.AAC.3